MLKKLLSAGVLLSLVVTVLVGAGAITASAQDLCATVDALAVAGIISADKVAAAKAAAGCGATPVAASYTFTRDLTVGATGADVTALQTMLGVTPATGYFGEITKAAVIAYQTSKGIAPAAGYVGPMTRASLNYVAPVVVTPVTPVVPTTPVMSGDEGELKTFSSLTGTDSSVEEGQEDVKVFGIKFDANDSDMMITRVDVDVDMTGSTGSSQLDNYITEVALMIDGDKVATMDVEDADEDNEVYSFRFKGLTTVVEEDATAKVYVLVSAVNNIDSDDAGETITVSIPDGGIRASDGAGISDTYDNNVSSKNFSIGEEDTATVTITEADSNPETTTLIAKESDDSSEFEVFVFNVESEDSASDVQEVTVDVVSAVSAVDKLVQTAILTVDGQEFEGTIASTTAISTSYSFDINGDVTIDADDDMDFVVSVVLNQQDGNYATSTESLTFSIDAVDVDSEDASTGDNNTETGSAEGNLMNVSLVGVSVTAAKSSTVTSSDDANGDYVTHKYTLSVKALEDTIYVPLTASTTASSTVGFGFDKMQTWTGTTTINVVQTSDLDEDSNSVKIVKGQTATIEVSITFNPTADGYYGVELNTVRFSEVAGAYELLFTAPDTSAFQTSNSFVTAL